MYVCMYVPYWIKKKTLAPTVTYCVVLKDSIWGALQPYKHAPLLPLDLKKGRGFAC